MILYTEDILLLSLKIQLYAKTEITGNIKKIDNKKICVKIAWYWAIWKAKKSTTQLSTGLSEV